MKRLFFFVFLHLIVFLILITSYSFAEDKVFTCKPTIAGVQLDNGNYYFENDYEDKTPLIDKLTTTQFILKEENLALLSKLVVKNPGGSEYEENDVVEKTNIQETNKELKESLTKGK